MEKANSAGVIKQGIDGCFHYVDQGGNWRRLHVWVQGTKFHISDVNSYKEYSVEGEFVGLAQIPTKE